MAFRVELTARAKSDLDKILGWLIDQGAGKSGLRWFQRLKEAIDSLSEFPHRCPLAPENAALQFEVRQLLYGHKPHEYRVLFTIDGDILFVLRIRHGRRQRLSRPH